MQYVAMWTLKGFSGGDLVPGQMIDANIADVSPWVAVAFGGAVPNPLRACLSPVADALATAIRDPTTYTGPMRDEGMTDEAIRHALAWNACPPASRYNGFSR